MSVRAAVIVIGAAATSAIWLGQPIRKNDRQATDVVRTHAALHFAARPLERDGDGLIEDGTRAARVPVSNPHLVVPRNEVP